MAEVVSVRFKEAGKAYFFEPEENVRYEKGEAVIVDTVRGVECGEVAVPNHEESEVDITRPLRKIIRRATEKDIKTVDENRKKEADAFQFCLKRVEALELDMKLVEVECAFDGSKILFYFTSDDRVDFRELVKNLASQYHTRIEMRQIGVRDVSKMLGGLGICGRPFCCSQFLNGFHPVSIKMAKEQGLSLNPTKISGCCGRLLCCLKYEQDTYEHLNKITPRVNTVVDTREGRGVVVESNLITGELKVKLDRRPDALPVEVNRSEVRIAKLSKQRDTEQNNENDE